MYEMKRALDGPSIDRTRPLQNDHIRMSAHSGYAVSPDEFLSFHNAGFGKLLGITFLEIQPSRVEVQLQVNDAVSTRPDVVHGGTIMALADCANGFGAILNLPPNHTTAT